MLDTEPVTSLEQWTARGGGGGLTAALRLGSAATVDELEASGLRGRGGAGFPTAAKWRTVLAFEPEIRPPSVVVNAAEGEPGSFKDRAILRNNPYRVLEGAMIAARTIGARRLVIATKARFTRVVARLRDAIAEVDAAGWTDGVTIDLVEGPSEYLFGEETALLEVVDGRYPFPRVSPPWRRGIDPDEMGPTRSAAGAVLAARDHSSDAPPTLVNNVETLANVAAIMRRGAGWFRELGTDASPGTIVCTVTGATERAGVSEIPLGTTLRAAIETIAGGPVAGSEIGVVLNGVSNAVITPDLLDTPLTYEDMAAAGTGLGSAGFIVFDRDADPVAIAHGASRFLAVESCGQCTPCKRDGLALVAEFERYLDGSANPLDRLAIDARLRTVAYGARCNLARQQEAVTASLLRAFPAAFRAADRAPGLDHRRVLVAPLVDIVDGIAVIDEREAAKQPDWTYDAVDSGKWPADRLEHEPGG